MRQTPFAISIEHEIADGLANDALKPIAQFAIVIGPGAQLKPCQPCCGSERHNARHIFGARPFFTFLMSANILGREPNAAPDEESTNALRAIEFMARQR